MPEKSFVFQLKFKKIKNRKKFRELYRTFFVLRQVKSK